MDSTIKGESKLQNNLNGVLKPGTDIKPKMDEEMAKNVVARLYGITPSVIKELNSYDDRNYWLQDSNVDSPLMTLPSPHGYVLKILNALDSEKPNFVEAQNQIMIYLAEQGIRCTKPIENINKKYQSVENIQGADHVVRLLEYVPGKIFHEVQKTAALLYQSGEYLAQVDQALKNFHHAAYETRKSVWMLQSIPQLKDFLYVLHHDSRQKMVREIIDEFECKVLSKLNSFETQIIHGDYNEQNIIVERQQNAAAGADGDDADYRVTGIIDFGDTNKAPLIFEVGVALTYMMLEAKSLESGGIFLAGYNSVRQVQNEERQYLKYCVAARLAQSLVLGAYTHSLNASNEYVLVTQEQGWKLIEELWCECFDAIDEIWASKAAEYNKHIVYKSGN